MNSTRNISVSFTGHRSYAGEADTALHKTLEQLYDEGFTRFLCGMAWGFDLAAGEAVLELRARHSEVELVAVVPYAEFSKLFRGDDLARYNRVAECADEVVVVSDFGGDAAFRMRNDYLVDNSSLVVAWFNGLPRGGTAYTVRQARKSRIEVINLYPNPQFELF